MFFSNLEELDADLAKLMLDTRISRELANAETEQDKEYWAAVQDTYSPIELVSHDTWERGDDLPF